MFSFGAAETRSLPLPLSSYRTCSLSNVFSLQNRRIDEVPLTATELLSILSPSLLPPLSLSLTLIRSACRSLSPSFHFRLTRTLSLPLFKQTYFSYVDANRSTGYGKGCSKKNSLNSRACEHHDDTRTLLRRQSGRGRARRKLLRLIPINPTIEVKETYHRSEKERRRVELHRIA